MKHTAISLGWDGVIAQLVHSDKDDRSGKPHKLILFQQQILEDNVCAPAQSVEVYGATAIMKLRDALNAAYPIEGAPNEQD